MKKITDQPVEDVLFLAYSLEKNLLAHKLVTKVVEVNFFPKYLEFQLDIVQGTKISDIESLSKDIAMILYSPTGKVEIIAPIPGKAKIGINLPRRTEKNKMEYPKQKEDEFIEVNKDFVFYVRHYAGRLLFVISRFLNRIGDLIFLSEYKIKN